MNLRFLTLLSWTPLAAFGQCSMCFRNAAAMDAQRQQALNLGILVLLLPPLVFLAGILYLAWRRNPDGDGVCLPPGGHPAESGGVIEP